MFDPRCSMLVKEERRRVRIKRVSSIEHRDLRI
jgi:hypothetical protein